MNYFISVRENSRSTIAECQEFKYKDEVWDVLLCRYYAWDGTSKINYKLF